MGIVQNYGGLLATRIFLGVTGMAYPARLRTEKYS